jgi:hypothetical protein
VPRRLEFLRDFRLTDVQWEGLQLPINLAFFVHSTQARRVLALYPSPAGATEALPPPDAWTALVEGNPVLQTLETDVEALLVNRLGPEAEYYRTGIEAEYYRTGIDECYTLVGLVRTHWRGLSGGTTIWPEIGRFFSLLRQRSCPGETAAHG